jgi:PEP-CTERM motif
MMRIKYHWLICIFSAFLLGASARADIIGVGPGAFPSDAPIINLSDLAFGTEVNGLTVNGVRFSYTVGGSPLNGAVQIDGGPQTTNFISPPAIVSVGNNTGVLTITLPSSANLFGYGFAILSEDDIADATTVSAFNGATLLGSLTFPGRPDPVFTGGFAGIQSASAFDRLELRFNSSAASAFALDNLTFANAVPEPSSLLLAVLGFGALAGRLPGIPLKVSDPRK